MTTTAPGWAGPTTELGTVDRPDPGPARPSVSPAERGQTIIGPSVVSTIAARAALSVTGVLRSEPSGLARVLRTGTPGLPDATARIEEGRATVQLKVTIAYPAPVWATAEEIRRAIRADVERLTAFGVGDIDLDVGLVRPPTTRRRVV